jgi:hypothetical protein
MFRCAQESNGRVPQLSGRPYAAEYDPYGAVGSKKTHHARVTDPGVQDRPGSWWQRLQDASAAVPEQPDADSSPIVRSVLPSAPWQPAQTVNYDEFKKTKGRHGCVANEMRYMPRTVRQ